MLHYWEGGEGFTNLSTAIADKFTTLYGGASNLMVQTSVLRSGALGAAKFGSPDVGGTATFYFNISGSPTEMVVEFWVWNQSGVGAHDVLTIEDGSGNIHARIRITPGTPSTVEVKNSANATVGSAHNFVNAQNWGHIGFKVAISDTGAYEIRLDDITKATGSADFKAGSNAFVGKIAFTAQGVFFSTSSHFDDVVILDTTGAEDNTFKGSSVHCISLLPSAAGDSTQWTPSAGANYQCVDDATPNGDTDYVASSTAGQLDLYNIANLPTTNVVVLGAEVWASARKDTGGTEQFKFAIKTNSTVYYGSTENPSSSYLPYRKQFLNNPNTSVKFTPTEINDLQIGQEVV